MIRPSHLTGMFGALTLMLCTQATQAGSATWDLNPGSGDWNTAANWTPMIVPNGPADTATFALSNTTNVSVSANIAVNGIIFTAAATNPYTITASPGLTLTISGVGITNSSGITQNFVNSLTSFSEGMIFANSATAGSSTTFTNNGFIQFRGSSTAGHATFTNNNGVNIGTGGGPTTVFFETSTAGNATFTNNGGASGTQPGETEFSGFSTAGNATIINNGGTASGDEGAFTVFSGSSTAGFATLIANAGTNGGRGGIIAIAGNSNGGSATLIANGGAGGDAGGAILFEEDATGGAPRVEVFGNGNLDISFHNTGQTMATIGSVEGDGNVFLGARTLVVGSNDLSTTFSGIIQDGGAGGGAGGSLTKIGSGVLDLTGGSTYTGSTKVNGGVLQVDGSITSNVLVDSNGTDHKSTLAGIGTVNGSVTNNGRVSPGDAPGILTVNSYTQTGGGTLLIDIAGANTGEFSVLNVLGTANLSGLLDPVLLNGFVPTIGESFTFLNYGAVTGSLFIFDRNIDGAAEHWNVTLASNNAILTVAPGNVSVPDRGSTLLLLTLSLLGLSGYRCLLWKQT